jgi:adrenodoxin-NADP+ reductase
MIRMLAHTKVDPTTRRAVPTGDTSTQDTSVVVTSLGFHQDSTTGHLRTDAGRIISPPGTVVKNVYASGSTETGAKGVLAGTMLDAYHVAETISSDWTENGDSTVGNAVREGRDDESSATSG